MQCDKEDNSLLRQEAVPANAMQELIRGLQDLEKRQDQLVEIVNTSVAPTMGLEGTLEVLASEREMRESQVRELLQVVEFERQARNADKTELIERSMSGKVKVDEFHTFLAEIDAKVCAEQEARSKIAKSLEEFQTAAFKDLQNERETRTREAGDLRAHIQRVADRFSRLDEASQKSRDHTDECMQKMQNNLAEYCGLMYRSLAEHRGLVDHAINDLRMHRRQRDM